MVKVKVKLNNNQEDFVAINQPNSSLISTKHIFAIFLIVALSVSLAIPTKYYFFNSSVNFSEDEDFLTQNDDKVAADLDSENQTLSSYENYEDYDIPKAVFTSNKSRQLESQNNSAESFASTNIEDNLTIDDKTTATADSKQEIEKRPQPTGTWYQQTVTKGDTLSKIFTYLNLPYDTLTKIVNVSKTRDLKLSIGDKLHFLIDDNNVVKEFVKPIAGNKQVRYIRYKENEEFQIIHEEVNAHIDDPKLIAKFQSASKMPLAVAAEKERQQQQQELLEQQQKIAAANATRPRLVVINIDKNSSFKSIAAQNGLTKTEIATIERQFNGKVNLNRLKAGDSLRILFNGIGTRAYINAVELKHQKETHAFYRNTDDNQFYTENGYKPTAGVFKRFPLAGNIKINSHFNPHRKHPVTKRISPHNGVDFKARVGTPVYAPADGTVIYRGYQRAAGYYIIVAHDGPYSTVYMHLSKIDVKKGQNVRAGQIIAKTGNTGRTTGPHLHYEVRINDRAVDPLKIDLPTTNNSRHASQQIKAFKDNVTSYKHELYKDSLAIRHD